ncbi:MAG TPA: chemotaxis protein CheB [Myxococcaceae bacterium]
MSALRILIVEDSLMVRRHLVDVISADPSCTVVGEAADGERGFQMCQRLRPDVVTLSLTLPGMNGVETTRRIMAACPTPVVAFAGAENRAPGLRLMDALTAGAVDALEKPARPTTGSWAEELLARVKLAARGPTRLHPAGPSRPEFASARELSPRAVVMGASTGGPSAVREILKGLPADFPLPLVLVMHLSDAFEFPMVEWLSKNSRVPVRHAVHGEPLPPVGQPGVVMARADRHLVLRGGRLWLTDEPLRNSCRPAVDLLFESAARELGPRAIGCLLTGMGRDGAEGLNALKEQGAMTLAQDEASSAVFGMPREAIQMGAARFVVSLKDMAGWLVTLARTGVPKEERHEVQSAQRR